MTHISQRRAVHAVLIMSATAALAGPAMAQQAPRSTEAGVQEVIVTGSRIQRPELEAPIPVISVSQDALNNLGVENVADLVTQLPQFAPAFGSSRTQSTFSGAAASGLNTVNLRNLSGLRSLVLINGRRVPGGTSTSTQVDMNTIPTANIERIEVLTGGASAIYGADAVAGVVNIITRKNFEGVELGTSYGETAEGDNQNPSAYMMLGGQFAEAGYGLITIQYERQDQVSCADRYICAEDFAWTSPSTKVRGPAAYSGVGLSGRFFLPDGTSVTRRGDSLLDTSGNLIPFSVAVDGYNRNPDRDLAIPTTRIMLAAEAEYELMDGVSAFAELNYGLAETDSKFESHPFQSQQAGSLVGGGPGVAGLQATIPINNPFIPAPLRASILAQNAAATDITWWQRFRFFDDRGANNNRETVRGAFGFNGGFDSIAGFGSNWNWEVSYVYGRTTVDSTTEGLVGTDRLYNGLRVEADPANPGQFRCIDPGARALGCVPVNPFGVYTQEMVDYLSLTAGQDGRSELEDFQAYIGGGLFELPAGTLSAAVGFERRTFSGFLDYDEVINRGLATGNQIGDVDFVERTSNEAYVEVLAPVVRDLPFARSVNVEAGYRRSDTDGTDEYDTWKYGGDWEPLEDVRFRVMRARAVRTPTPGELSGIGQTFGVVQDPCTASRRNANATRAANCAADGVPDGYTPALVLEQSVSGFTGGNPNLDPEEATTLTYGVVWTPSFLPGFAVTLDRFELEIDQIITSVARQTAANLCYDTPDRQFCDVLQRGQSPLLPGANYVLLSVNEQQQNVAAYDISGFDLQLSYGFDIGAWGRLALDLSGTIYDKAEQVPLPGEEPLDLLGFAGGSTIDQGYIRRTGRFNANYSIGNFGANWNIRYIGRADMSPFVEGYPEVGSHAYNNARFSYAFGDESRSEVYLGVTNVFDKEPPFFASGTSGTQALDTIPGYYDVFGRSYFGGVRVTF